MKKVVSQLYFWVIVAIFLGGMLGLLQPQWGIALKPLGDGFIKLIKMLIAPIIFVTIVQGIAGMQNMKTAGRIAGKALLYFEVVSTFALIIGLVMVNVLKPGAQFKVDPHTLNMANIVEYTSKVSEQTFSGFALDIIPNTFFNAFAQGELLQVLFLSILFGCALALIGEQGKPISLLLAAFEKLLFKMVHLVMKAAPIGVLGAMAFTLGQYGATSLAPLLKLIASFYLAGTLFVVIILGSISACIGFNIFKFIAYLKTEFLTVLGTASSESVLAPLMEKLERLGCSEGVVGLVVPSGYSFNLDGTNIYLPMAALFIAQALNIDLSWTQQLTLLGVAMLTSKGASGVTGAGFITLAATLMVIPSIPVAGLAIILGIDRFMSQGRSLVNLIGNSVATIVVAKWERELDMQKLREKLSQST